MKTIKIIIVEDHFLLRMGLRNTFKKPEGDIQVEVVAEAATASAFYQLLNKGVDADIVLLDIKLPDESGIEIAKRLEILAPKLKILVLSAETNEETVLELMKVRIGGFISKSVNPPELFRAIESVSEDVPYYGKDIAKLMQNIRLSILSKSQIKFTPKELAILKLSGEGLYAKEIATKLCISYQTVGVHKSNIFKKLGINSSVELVKYAIKMGFVQL